MKRLFVIALLLGASMAAHAAPPAPAGQYNINGQIVSGFVSNCWDLSALALAACNQHGQPLAYSGSASASVATTSGTLVAAGAYKRSLQICTLPASTNNIWLRPDGSVAVVGSGVPIYGGGGCVNFGTAALPLPTGTITAITDSAAAQTVVMAGG